MKIGRNDPCLCGSGKKYKKCCIDNDREEIDEKISQKMWEDQATQEEKMRKDTISECLEEVSESEKKELLLELSCLALMPCSNILELRFLYLTQIICFFSDDKNKKENIKIEKKDYADKANQVFNKFNKIYGEGLESYEVDNIYVPYISWINYNNNTFRTFSGSLTESELYINDLILKLSPLEESFKQICGVSISEVFNFFIPRINKFIDVAKLYQYENLSSQDKKDFKDKQDIVLSLIRKHYRNYFAFPKNDLDDNQKIFLKLLSQKVENYKPNYSDLMNETADIMLYPIIEFDEEFILLFPSLIFTALRTHVFNMLSSSKEKESSINIFNSAIEHRVEIILKNYFGDDAVISNAYVNGKKWCDFAVHFDNKIIQISLALNVFGDDNISPDEILERTHDSWQVIEKNPQSPIRCDRGVIGLRKIDYEPIYIIMVDTLSMFLAAGLSGKNLKDDCIVEMVNLMELEFLMRIIDNPIKLVKFIRTVTRVRQKVETITSTSILEVYSLFERNETIQFRDSQKAPNMLSLVSLFPGTLLEELKKFRGERIIYDNDGRKMVLRAHYPGVYGEGNDDKIFFIIPFNEREIEIETIRPKIKDKVLIDAMYLSFDSLCYYLPLLKKKINQIMDRELSGLKKIKLIFQESIKDKTIEINSTKQKDEITINFFVSRKQHEIFKTGDNSGERGMLDLFFKGLGDKLDFESIVNKLLPRSEERGFQAVAIPVLHKSLEIDVEPIFLTKTDKYLVDEEIAGIIRQSKIKSGVYPAELKVIEPLIGNVFIVLQKELEKKLSVYNFNTLVKYLYNQLEITYIHTEREKFHFAISQETAKYGNIKEEFKEKMDELTMLAFSIRHLIETATKIQPKGNKKITIEDYTEILAFSDRVVNLDFMGDSIYYGFLSGKFEITKGGYVNFFQSGEMKHVDAYAKAEMKTYLKRTSRDPTSKPHKKDIKENIITQLEESFDNSFKEEYGYTLKDRNKFIESLFNKINQQLSPIIISEQSKLIQYIIDETKLEKPIAMLICDDLKLSPKKIKSEGDIHPSTKYWREERIINKPIISFEVNSNIYFLLSRSVLERCYISFIDRLSTGRISNLNSIKSPSLKSELGRWTSEYGDKFRDKTEELLDKNNWKTKKELKSLNNTSFPDNMGPVDIIAVSKERHEIFIIECKKISFSRNPKDTQTEKEKFFGNKTKNKKGYFDILNDKYKWISKNEEKLFKEFNLNRSVSWKIKPLLLTSELLISAQYQDTLTPTMYYGELEDYIKNSKYSYRKTNSGIFG